MTTRRQPVELYCFFLLFAGLSLALPPLLFVTPQTPLWVLLFLEFLVLGVALELSEILAAAACGVRDLPKLERLPEFPPVAVLFLVCDDLVPHALERLVALDCPQADLFILDDSTDAATRRALDATGLRVVRRERRRGAKAGNLNHWLQRYGARYKYFLVLDSDSIIPAGFVEAILTYAEHPENARVAIFNSLPVCWNTDLRFPRLLATHTPLRNWSRIRLANRSDAVLSNGHNNLHRTEAVIRVGGFDEAFVAEDIALTLKLLRAGYTSRLVNLRAFEAEPEHVFSYVRRLARWARQNVQIHRADWQGIPLSVKFEMFKLNWWYISFFFYPAWVVLAVWSRRTSQTDVRLLWEIIALDGRQAFSLFAPSLAVLLLALSPVLLRVPLLIREGIRLRDYAGNCVLSMAIAAYATPAVCRAQARAAVSDACDFEVTDKRVRRVTLGALLMSERLLIPFWLFLSVGFWFNRVALVFSSLWFFCSLLAPLLIYCFHERRPPSQFGQRHGGQP
ncbi:MAG TPA: glycosyltransferase family 2 protein [Pyrinomonadaceae bacterium]|nr:glycosyltransferase family 2 protein [Pyrinomonadaceae bacterium]